MMLLYNMPYFLRKVAGGFKVCDTNRCFSKNPLPLKQAQKQRVAIALSEHAKNPKKPMNYYFK
jgi:hypothetical protein